MTVLRGARMAIAIALAVSALAAGGAQAASPDGRAAALVAAMTLDEKIQLVHGIAVCRLTPGDFPGSERSLKGAGFIPGIPRLGIPDINYTDAGAGVTNCGARPTGQSTMLPAPLARASSWSTATTYDAGALLGREARVQGFTGLLGGVSELIREPRWGRSFETLGEDPVLNGTLVASELRGVQDQTVVATIKHFAANNQETGRQVHSVEIDERTLRELHLLPYEIAVPASRVGSVMCSYNKVNGTYACENDDLINRFLKGELGFKGQVQSDWGATHSTVAAALAGLDEEEFRSQYFAQALKDAVQAGQVPQARLDDMVRRKLRTLIAVGVLDDPPGTPGSVDVSYGAAVTERIARQSQVLLKNERRTLPLSRRTRSIAVIGSHADVGVLSGGGSSQVTPPGGPAIPPACNPEGPGGSHCPVWAPSSPLQAIRSEAPGADVRYADGSDADAAAALAASSDVAVVFANEWRQEGEDRPDLNLPDGQEALIRRVAAANRSTVVVLENGGPLVMPWIGDVKAVLEAWYPGSRGGPAIADILFGDVNPSGKLTVTFPRDAADTPTGAAPPTDADSDPLRRAPARRLPLVRREGDRAAVRVRARPLLHRLPLLAAPDHGEPPRAARRASRSPTPAGAAAPRSPRSTRACRARPASRPGASSAGPGSRCARASSGASASRSIRSGWRSGTRTGTTGRSSPATTASRSAPRRATSGCRSGCGCLAVGGDRRHQLGEHALGVLVGDLAGAGRVVAAAAVGEHQLADVGAGGAVDDRLAGGEDRVLLLEAPEHVDRHVRLGIERVDHEAVGRVDDLLVAEVEHDEVALDARAAVDLVDGAGAVLVVELDALGDVRGRAGSPRRSSRCSRRSAASSAGSWRSGTRGSGRGRCAGPSGTTSGSSPAGRGSRPRRTARRRPCRPRPSSRRRSSGSARRRRSGHRRRARRSWRPGR